MNRDKLTNRSNGSSPLLSAADPGLTAYTVAIIGGGPKGTYALERLIAQFAANPVAGPVDIYIFNRSIHFGAGDIYHPEQPDYLLINYAIGNINMWSDEKPPAVVPDPLPLTEWLQQQHEPRLAVSEHDYVSRAKVGRYLKAGFAAILDHLPPNVTVHCVVGDVADCKPVGQAYQLTVQKTDGSVEAVPTAFQQVLLATGHPRNKPNPITASYQRFAAQHLDTEFIPFVYPVEPTLRSVPASAHVGMKGIGLTFIDATFALTEGKGGRFVRGESGELHYHPAGTEPAVIYPFSRSGLPMLPRGPVVGPTSTPLRFFTPVAVATIRARATAAKRAVDFETELWPLLERELTHAYYRVSFQLAGEAEQLTALSSYAELQEAIAHFHERQPEVERFTPADFLDPLQSRSFATPAEQHEWLVGYLRFMINEAYKGAEQSPWMAAAAVWRQATPLFQRIFQFGGLTPASHRAFMTRYASALNRISFGPPIASAEKLVALAEAEILNFGMARGADVQLDQQRGRFQLQSNIDGSSRAVTHLIDARIPKVALLDDQAGLYQNLLRRGTIQPFANRGRQREHNERPYYPGCLALASKAGLVISGAGHVNPRMAATGTPTEGITHDNDSLSRSCNNFASDWAAHVRAQYAHMQFMPSTLAEQHLPDRQSGNYLQRESSDFFAHEDNSFQ